MTSEHNSTKTTIAAPRLGTLFCIFFLIACGLGYPILNRFDPRQSPGLSDVKTYAALVTGTTIVDAEDMRFRRFRVLVPWIAKPFYLLARGHTASWDPVMFGLLVADSLFVAATAVLIVMIGCSTLGNSAVGLVGALLYMVNFAVPNLRLAGLVDAGEGFFLLALLWSLSERRLWLLPVIAVLGTLTKESFIPFSIVLTSGWWLSMRRTQPSGEESRYHSSRDAAWILVSWTCGMAAMIFLHRSITGNYVNPLQFGTTLQRGGGQHFAVSLRDRNLWYIFLWLLPTAIPNLKRFPKSWLIPITAACTAAFVLDAYFGGTPAAGSAWGRALFSIAGPVLSLSSALTLMRFCGVQRDSLGLNGSRPSG
ncbi:MAG TPA: hypothetical protein VK828_10395 [Terriglobales bacterium]|jgi:hypothetical protein|nr:hypothetical protein [Terriglobales bacterium]